MSAARVGRWVGVRADGSGQDRSRFKGVDKQETYSRVRLKSGCSPPLITRVILSLYSGYCRQPIPTLPAAINQLTFLKNAPIKRMLSMPFSGDSWKFP